MKNQYTILIADRNSRVRNFMGRELTAAGYRVRLAQSGREVLELAHNAEPPDLIILDPDLPDIDEASLFAGLQNRSPLLPIIIHALLPLHNSKVRRVEAIFVEKQGNSIEDIKAVVEKMRSESDRWANKATDMRREI